MKNIWEELYNAYPVNSEMIWLNNCGTTPASKYSIELCKEFLDAYSKKGVLNDFAKFNDVHSSLTGILSGLLNCKQDELAIMHNTAEGINFISRGLKLDKGSEILLLENEYPSNVYPWEHWKEKGVNLKVIPVGKTKSKFLDNLRSLLTTSTRLISISSVHWCTGMPLPLKEVGEICKKN
ncbi:MAG: aminotransferase class V-fold PLP-dependent enzyme, partial [Leptospiraceae bacterium]|nr:aminotransferase class V-fold PLP-dependent enzyme [Leptospiraceae bacterium]